MTNAIRLPSRHRRLLLAGVAGLAALAGAQPLQAAASAWERDDADRLGMSPDLGTRLDQGVRSGELENLHAVFVVRRGKVAVERYYEGPDERWGTPLGKVAFGATTLHDVRSISKSIVGLLYGIALAEGRVPDPDMPVLESFPAFQDLARDERRRRIRIAHVLAMTMGLAWNEDLPYTDPRNSELAMERSGDRFRYVLEQPVVAPPGQQWRYSGGATAILGHLVSKGAGVPLLEFARTRLFTPLGIDAVEWTPGSDGEAAAASGLRLRAGDLARVGQLLLQQGAWDGRQLLPREWIAACMTPRVDAFEGVRYGYQWYVARRNDGSAAYMAFGLGGQRLVVIPSLELASVIFMGNYRRPDQVKLLLAVQKLIQAAIL